MSVVCARIYKDKIQIAADSIFVGALDTKVPCGCAKLEQYNGITFGYSGTAAEGAMFSAYVKTHTPEGTDSMDITRFMVEFAKWKNDYSDNKTVSNHYILVYGGKVYCLEGIVVFPVKEFYAIGYGFNFALAALHLGHSPREAVHVACELSCYVAEPIVEYEIML